MLDDGVAEVAEHFHRHGLVLDVWTLNGGTSWWKEGLARALAAGVDGITTDTPHDLSRWLGEADLASEDAASEIAKQP
jgi:glycerophosphoryl diester phosphodiesterase